jgi:predicted MPP superfamily phosphohydrolase
MTLFLLSFLILYGGMHLYMLVKVRCAFGISMWILIPLIIFMLIMVLSPLIIRVSERAGMEWLALPMAYAGYMWMGFLFLFFCGSFLLDLGRFFIYFIGLLSGKDLSRITSAHTVQFCVALSCAALITCYGFFEARHIGAEHIVIRTEKLPSGMESLRIAQISDLHLGLIVREELLTRVIDEVKKMNPHMLVVTGDLLDGQMDSLSGIASLFKEVEPRFGTFAVAGNHEFYAGIDNFTALAETAGLRVLRGEGLTVDHAITVAGIDDIAGGPYHLYRGVDEKELLSRLDRSRFVLLLKHRPVIDKDAVGLFDLQLSGHTHNGQIFPFKYVTKLFFFYTTGYHRLGGGAHLYVSRGTGTWGPPIRFLSPPEVTLIELKPRE